MAKNAGSIKMDYLWRVKEAILSMLTKSNNNAPQDQAKITWEVVRTRAVMIRDHLLEKHREGPFLIPQEVTALASFRAGKKWCLDRNKDAELQKLPTPSTEPTVLHRKTKPSTITINGKGERCATLRYHPNEYNRISKDFSGVMAFNDAHVDVAIHDFTKRPKGDEGCRPRYYPPADVAEKINTPLIDNKKGDIVTIDFRNGMQNILFFASKNNNCTLCVFCQQE